MTERNKKLQPKRYFDLTPEERKAFNNRIEELQAKNVDALMRISRQKKEES